MSIRPCKRPQDESSLGHQEKKEKKSSSLQRYFVSSIQHTTLTEIAGQLGYGNFDRDYRKGICTGISTMANIAYLSGNHRFYDSTLEKIQTLYEKYHVNIEKKPEAFLVEAENDLEFFLMVRSIHKEP